MKTMQDTIYTITVPTPYAVGDVHVYILKGRQVTMIDAGVQTEEAWESMKHQLVGWGLSPGDIDQIVLTHHHPDHIGLTDRFPNVKSIYAHEKALPWLKREEEFMEQYVTFFRNFYEDNGVPHELIHTLTRTKDKMKDFPYISVSRTLKEGERVPGHEEWTIIETPGHAESHISLFREEDGTFIGGDHLLAHISPNPIIEPPFQAGPRPKPLLKYRHSLKKLKRYPIRKVYPGHGAPFSNVGEVIDLRLSHQEKRAEKVYDIVNDSSSNAFEISMRLFPKQYRKQFSLTMSETVGQLDYLIELGRISVDTGGGQEIYYVNK